MEDNFFMYQFFNVKKQQLIIIVSYSVARIYLSAKITYLSAGKQDVSQQKASFFNAYGSSFLINAVFSKYVHLIHATFQSNCVEGLHFSAFHYYWGVFYKNYSIL